MPDDRFIHPRLGHGERVFQLTDMEFRVWMQYLLTADDCGVMRCSAMTIQAANERLAKVAGKKLDAALTKLVTLGLLVTFQHQGWTYLCQLDWQEWQKVRWPRASVNPQPDAATLEKCTMATQALFATQAKHHRSALGAVSAEAPSAHGDATETPPSMPGAVLRHTATAAADGNGHGARPARTGSGALAGGLPRDHLRHKVCGRVCLHETQFEQFVKKLGGAEREAAQRITTWARERLDAWDLPPLLDKTIQGNNFQWWDARWLEWQGSPTAAKGAAKLPTPVPWICTVHTPPCSIQWRCQQLIDIAAEKASARA